MIQATLKIAQIPEFFILFCNQKHYMAMLAEKVSWMKMLITGYMHKKSHVSTLTFKVYLNKLKAELSAKKMPILQKLLL